MFCLFLLTGCADASGGLGRGMALRDSLLERGCSFEAEITADYGEQLHRFSLSCQADAQGNVAFTVTQPQSIAGITGTVAASGGKLTFEDTALHFDLLADGQIAPVTAPWILVKTLRSGYMTAAGEEGALLRLTIDDSYDDDALQLDVWLDETDAPIWAELLYDGRRILSLDVTGFVIG